MITSRTIGSNTIPRLVFTTASRTVVGRDALVERTHVFVRPRLEACVCEQLVRDVVQ